MTSTKLQFAAALCAGIGLLSLTPAQAATAPTTPGTSLAALLSRLQADETKQAADEATMTSQAAAITHQGATITNQGGTIATLQSQLSAVAGVPKNAALLAQTPVPAPGYTYTGNFVAVSGSAWTYQASMKTARDFPAAATIGNTIYALGGFNNGLLSSVEAYDPATNTWASKANMSTARYAPAAASVGNTLYALGGFDSGSNGYLSSV